MATNLVRFNVYQINNRVMDRDVPQNIAFPTQGVLVYDVSTSPQRSLSSGYNVYAMLQIPSTAAADSSGTDFYVAETVAQVVTIFNS